MDKEQRKRKRAEEESTRGASSSSSISPEATGLRSGQYDVFLNFRGSDTRKTFTDHLYHNLVKAGTVPFCVFRDENSIPIGEEFGLEILDAIERSKISIPIISENYASSKWCLRELVHILKCKRSTSHIVLPIFYKVAPSDVRHLKGKFGNAFHLSRERFDEKDIREWQRALNEVSCLNGWESNKFEDGHEGELIEHVVGTVISKLQDDFQLHVPKQLVGLDGCLKEIMNWIDSPSINARMIGIYGMGGIGKTTLAKIIYNQLLNKFVDASFLPDVRETIKLHGITYLQRQLILDILRSQSEVSRIDDGINIIKSRFKGRKVLILLDDIDDKNQLDALAGEHNWFTVGSLIIVTTRNEAVLDQSEFEVDYKYELNGLNEVHALLLFNRHAFRMDHSPRDFEGISHNIISTMGGLPLALQVVGSYLYKKTNKRVWEDVWKQLKNQPHRDVQKILQISYDALEDGHKQIFLDIVCFFIGETSKYAMYMWEDCGFYPSQGIEELKLRCLIKIGDDDKFEMHDQLRDLGRSIFCQGQPLKKHSGPWDVNYRGIPRVLRHLGGFVSSLWRAGPRKYSTGLYRPSSKDSMDFSWRPGSSSGERFRHLFWNSSKDSVDLSWFQGAASSKHSMELFSEVRWFQWESDDSDLSLWTTNLHLPNLSVLLLHKKIWEGWSLFMASKQLKVLNLTRCSELKCTPDFSAFTQLKILSLVTCVNLECLHPSIGKLTSLVSLNLLDCRGLRKLPKEVGELKDLEELSLDGSGITMIPTSIGSLRKLEKLTASCGSLREIPSSIGDLQNLQHLDLSYSGVQKLPSAIGRLKNLRTLDLFKCHGLEGTIPSEIGDLSSLEVLNLYWTPISDLPESIWNLSSLQRLNLRFCSNLRSLPEIPSSLQHLYLRGRCKPWSLPELPSSLQHLDLGYCSNLRLLPELPSSLQYLDLEDCCNLWSLPELPLGLTYLSVTCESLRWQQLFSLIHLEELRLVVCHLLEDSRELSSITSELCFEEWDKLTSLKLKGLKHLEEVSIKKCSSIKKLDLSGLCGLKRLHVEHCDSLVEIQLPEDLIDRIIDCGVQRPWEVIFLYDCNSIKSLLCPRSRCLKKLVVVRCNNLVEIQGLDGAPFLEELDFTGCKSIETLPDLMGCEKLRSIRVQDCKKLTQLQGLEKLNLIDLDISGCGSLEAIPNLSRTRVFRNYEQELSFDS